jgi:diguanylate cyclase (GGDEF)-like protein
MPPNRSDTTRTADGKMPMQRALARALAMLAALVVTASLLVVFATGSVLLRRYAHENLAHVAWQAAYAAEVAVVFNDRAAAADAVRNATGLEGITAITVRNAAGQTVARVLREGLDEADVAEGWLDPRPVTHDIVNGGTAIGSVEVRGETTGVLALLLACLLSSLVAGALAWVMTRFVARRLRQEIIEPLHAIAAAAHGISSNRDLKARAPRSDIAEVDALSLDINRLLDELEGWQVQVDAAHQQLLDLANHDTLSGLPNRTHFLDHLRATLNHAQRSGQRFALLYLDGDRFKTTNDQYGHAAGDALIREIGARLLRLATDGVEVARMGGDEFAMLMPAIADNRDVDAMANRIADAMQAPVTLHNGTMLTTSLSIGMAIYPEDGTSADALIAHADAAMYAGKAARGRNRATD